MLKQLSALSLHFPAESRASLSFGLALSSLLTKSKLWAQPRKLDGYTSLSLSLTHATNLHRYYNINFHFYFFYQREKEN
jgi:hypothetical protein